MKEELTTFLKEVDEALTEQGYETCKENDAAVKLTLPLYVQVLGGNHKQDVVVFAKKS